MVSAAIGGLNKTVLQIAAYQIAGELLSAYLLPYQRAASQQANDLDANAVLSPEILADMVERGHLPQTAAAGEAKRSGLDEGHFALLVANSGEPPGIEMLAEMLRRGIIQEGATTDEGVSYLSGIAQSRLQTKWADAVKAVSEQIPSIAEIVLAYLKGHYGVGQAQADFKRAGGDPDDWSLYVDIAGEGPSPDQAALMARRGLIPWTGSGGDVVSFQQAVAESHFRNKWTDAYKGAAQYLPPPRTIVAMWREGSIDTAKATTYLLQYGVPEADVPSYLTVPKKSTLQTAHQATEAEILRLYQEKAITQAEASTMLKQHGYSDTDIPILLEYGDLQVRLRQEQAAITPIHALFRKGRIDFNRAKSLLTDNQVPESRADYLLAIWELERAAGTKDLTSKEIFDAVSLHLIPVTEALTRLMAMGYSSDDAALLVQLNTLIQFQPGQGGELTGSPPPAEITSGPTPPPGPPGIGL